MTYKDPIKQREYQRQWIASRKSAWFADKVCDECGSGENLQLDHRDPTSKVSHKIWAWSLERRTIELAKCQALCQPCHDKKSRTEKQRGVDHHQAKLTEDQVRQIRLSTESDRKLGKQYGVAHATIFKIRHGEKWKHLILGQGYMTKLCEGCKTELSDVLVAEGMYYHLICAPEDVFKAWLKKYEYEND